MDEKEKAARRAATLNLAIAEGKQPPNALEFEKLVIGTFLIDARGVEKGLFVLGDNTDIFYDPRHAEIYAVIFSLNKKGLPIDIMTVIQELKRTEKLTAAGGDHYVIDLTMGVSSSAHLEYHLRILMEKYFARLMQYQCNNALTTLYSESADVFEQISNLRDTVQKIEDTVNQTQDSINSKKAHAAMLEQYKENAPPIVPIQYADLRGDLDGLREGDFMIIGARPSIGKTAVGLNFATQTARQNIPTGVFSLEMSVNQLHQRVAADVCDISFYRLYRKILYDNEMQRLYGEGASELEKMPLQYDESRNIFQILSKIRIMAKRGVKLIVLDYIQIVNTDGVKIGSREQEISFISRSLKSIALELKIAVIALAQVSRNVEARGIKRPTVADLRESGALEQDADIICLLYRPEFYGVQTWDCNWAGAHQRHNGLQDQDTEQQIELQFAKYRNGSPFTVRMRFWGDKMRLNNFDSINHYENAPRTFSGQDGRKELTDDDDFETF